MDSFGAFFFDYDNDGWLDLFVAGCGGFEAKTMAADVAADYLGLPTTAERGRLYRNKGDGTFADVTKAAGLYRVVPAMGLNFGDLDNDGWLDIYLGTGNPDFGTLIPNRMFRNADGRSFQDVTTAGNFGHLQKGHAIAFGDVDNDGDQDVFEEMGGAFLADKAYSALYLESGRGQPLAAPGAAGRPFQSERDRSPHPRRAEHRGRKTPSVPDGWKRWQLRLLPHARGDRPQGRQKHRVGRSHLARHRTDPTAHGVRA